MRNNNQWQMPKVRIKIDRNVPIPQKETNPYHNAFEKMNVGDSFAIEDRNPRKLQTRILLHIQNYNMKYKKKYKFTTRVDPKKKHVRVWRTK